jgi:uncharacterized YigZ family protein
MPSMESSGIYTEKGSKFIAYVFPVENEETIKQRLTELRKKHFDARHHCYAYILYPDKSAYRLNDDGEPSGTAARPIYGQLLSKNLTNILLVVVRYFGGTKLGVPGLINAYKTAANNALEQNKIIDKTIDEAYTLYFDISLMNQVMQILKNDGIRIIEQGYDNQCFINFLVRRNNADVTLVALKKIFGVKVLR